MHALKQQQRGFEPGALSIESRTFYPPEEEYMKLNNLQNTGLLFY